MSNQSLKSLFPLSKIDEKNLELKKFEGFKTDDLSFLPDVIEGSTNIIQKLDRVCKSMRPTHKSKLSSPISNYNIDENGKINNVKYHYDEQNGKLNDINIDYICVFPKHSNVEISSIVNENIIGNDNLIIKNTNTKNRRKEEYSDIDIDKKIAEIGLKNDKIINIDIINKNAENKSIFKYKHRSNSSIEMALVGNIWEYNRHIYIDNGNVKDISNFSSYKASIDKKLEKIKKIYQEIYPDWESRYNIIKKELEK